MNQFVFISERANRAVRYSRLKYARENPNPSTWILMSLKKELSEVWNVEIDDVSVLMNGEIIL